MVGKSNSYAFENDSTLKVHGEGIEATNKYKVETIGKIFQDSFKIQWIFRPYVQGSSSA